MLWCQVPPSGLVFRYGRVDCPTAPNTTVNDTFPGADLNNTGGAETKRFCFHIFAKFRFREKILPKNLINKGSRNFCKNTIISSLF